VYNWCGIADRWCCFYVVRAILTSHSGHTSCAPPVAPLARLWGHCQKNAQYARRIVVCHIAHTRHAPHPSGHWRARGVGVTP